MATRFEIALWGGSEAHLRAAGQEALHEIERLERQLSLYRPDSDIADLNARAAGEPVPVDPRLFDLLRRAARLTKETGGAFDITIAPLLRAWGFLGGSGQMPVDAAVEAAREIVGMHLVELNEAECTVRFRREGVMLDLGAIGKGYAIEQAADILRASGIGGALLHGGTSTIQAIGTQPDGSPWPVAIHHPLQADQHLAILLLRDRALSVSAVHGKSFVLDDLRYGHVLDPRIGRPVQGALLSAVLCPSATDSDALSTALLVRGESFLGALEERGETGGLVALPIGEGRIQLYQSRFGWAGGLLTS
jgi:thiamine biosynthesis lipoprotein